MSEQEKLSVSIYNVVKGIHDVLILPTQSTLHRSLIFSVLLTICSGLSSLIGIYTFISWQGAITCTVLLTILFIIERFEFNALSKVYRNAKLSVTKIAQRAKNAGASKFNSGHTGNRRKSKGGTGKRSKLDELTKRFGAGRK